MLLLWVAIGIGSLWFIEGLEWILDANFGRFGIYPRKWESLPGIFLAPFIHGDWAHLASNSLPLFFLTLGLFYFYRPIAWQVLAVLVVGGGIWVWVAARSSYHIGASGLVYGLAFFLFFSGVFRKDARAIALALVVAFFYGSMVWGIFPAIVEAHVSWESHLFGGLAGIVAAYYYRKKGLPPRKRYAWEDEPEETGRDGFQFWNYKDYLRPPDGFKYK